MQQVCSPCSFHVLQLIYLALKKANNAALGIMMHCMSHAHPQNTLKESSPAGTHISTNEDEGLVQHTSVGFLIQNSFLSIPIDEIWGDKAVRLAVMIIMPKYLPHARTLSCGSAWKCICSEWWVQPSQLILLNSDTPTSHSSATSHSATLQSETYQWNILLIYCPVPRLVGIPPT